MMRSLWSAASGMKGQQVSVDTIANNLANVNTTAYKSQSTQFKTLLYQTMQSTSTNGQGETKPTSAQVGLGTRVASINANFTQGSQLAKDSPTAMCIIGNGFFDVYWEFSIFIYISKWCMVRKHNESTIPFFMLFINFHYFFHRLVEKLFIR